MIRVCSARRWRQPPTATAAGERELRRCVLDLVLEAHPLPLTFHAIASLLSADPADLAAALALAAAVRDLALVDLLRSDGLRVVPTRAALYFDALESD